MFRPFRARFIRMRSFLGRRSLRSLCPRLICCGPSGQNNAIPRLLINLKRCGLEVARHCFSVEYTGKAVARQVSCHGFDRRVNVPLLWDCTQSQAVPPSRGIMHAPIRRNRCNGDTQISTRIRTRNETSRFSSLHSSHYDRASGSEIAAPSCLTRLFLFLHSNYQLVDRLQIKI